MVTATGVRPIMEAPTWTLEGTVLVIETFHVPLCTVGTVPITEAPKVPLTDWLAVDEVRIEPPMMTTATEA